MSNARKEIPIPKPDLRFLLHHLAAHEVHLTCDHTLRRTETLLRILRIWSDEVRDWLEDHGGYCDCEVLFNVGNYWRKRLQM